jgi:hypothetical protein
MLLTTDATVSFLWLRFLGPFHRYKHLCQLEVDPLPCTRFPYSLYGVRLYLLVSKKSKDLAGTDTNIWSLPRPVSIWWHLAGAVSARDTDASSLRFALSKTAVVSCLVGRHGRLLSFRRFVINIVNDDGMPARK